MCRYVCFFVCVYTFFGGGGRGGGGTLLQNSILGGSDLGFGAFGHSNSGMGSCSEQLYSICLAAFTCMHIIHIYIYMYYVKRYENMHIYIICLFI